VTEVLERDALLAQDLRIDLGFEGERKGAATSGNRQLLVELVANLVDNALRYTPAGGTVTVRVQPRKDRIDVIVEDDGPGIPAADRARVFERFCRLENSRSDGCGLGLAIVREIARSHRAQVTLEDTPSGKGLTARVSFVAAAA